VDAGASRTLPVKLLSRRRCGEPRTRLLGQRAKAIDCAKLLEFCRLDSLQPYLSKELGVILRPNNADAADRNSTLAHLHSPRVSCVHVLIAVGDSASFVEHAIASEVRHRISNGNGEACSCGVNPLIHLLQEPPTAYRI